MKITVGMIGLGNILSSHLEGIKANPELELVSVTSHTQAKIERWSKELGVKGFPDYHKLIDDKPDVVVVSLPHGMHCEVTVEALEAGCHVMTEKPMAVSVAECNRMLETAHRCGKLLLVTETAVSAQPGPGVTGRKFKAGQLGRFFTGSIINERFYFHETRPAWFLDPAMSGGGMFSNVGVHRLSVARACLPGLTPISVTGSVCHVPEYQVEACTSAIVKYREGGSMLYEEVGYYPKPAWMNVGTHFVFEEGIVMWDDKTWQMMKRNGEQVEEAMPPGQKAYAAPYAEIVRAIRGEEYGPKAWEFAVDMSIALAAYASSREGRQIDLTSPGWAIHK